jgi:hypothetical protein
MITENERIESFEKDLVELLKKHCAEITLLDTKGNGDEQLYVIMDMVYAPNSDEILKEYATINYIKGVRP